MNVGPRPVPSQNNLLTTIGWHFDGRTTYCLEGSVFVAGAVVQWLRDGLGIIRTSAEVERLAGEVSDSGGVYFVPALVGLGVPHWDPYARGAIFGLTRGTTAAHLARAALESMAFQTCDVLDAMQKDAGIRLTELKVDGGASVNHALMQFQADVLGVRVCRPVVAETTALGRPIWRGWRSAIGPTRRRLPATGRCPPLPHHRTSGSASGGSEGLSYASVNSRGSPFSRRTAAGNAVFVAGLFATRHGPRGFPAPCAARSLPRNPCSHSFLYRTVPRFHCFQITVRSLCRSH